MIHAVFLADRRNQNIVLHIIVDHGLRQNFVVLRIPCALLEMLLHKGQNLIHIQINSRDLVRRNEQGFLHHPVKLLLQLSIVFVLLHGPSPSSPGHFAESSP